MWPFDQNNQWVYQQYAQAYDTGNYGGFEPNQVLGHLSQFMQNAPYDMQQQVYQQHFSQMPYEQRALLAQQMPQQYGVNPNDPMSITQGFMRMGQEQPHMLQRIFSHPLLLGAAVGLAGIAAKHILSHHRIAYEGQQYNQGAFQGQGYNQGPNYNQGYQQNPYMQQEIAREQQEINTLRRELREEEREEGHHRRHHDQDW